MLRIAALAGALALWGSVALQEREIRPRHVILISIDGLAAFHLDDASVDLPNIRALAADGVHASAETVFPSMTHPAHTTLITGTTPRDHGVLNNRVVDRRTGQRFHMTNLPREQSIRVPTLFDAVRRQGRATAALFWPETRDDASIDDNIAEVFDARGMADPAVVAPALMAELRLAGVPIDSYFSLYDDPFSQGAADLVLTRAAVHLLKVRRPALLALHLLVADKVQHEVGAAHYRSKAALTAADHCVGLIRSAVADAGMADQTTIVVVADHGFVTVREELNLAPVLEDPALAGRVRWMADGWYVWAELTAGFVPARDEGALERALSRAAETAGVARVIRPGEFTSLGYPDYAESPYVPGHYLVVGDLDTHLTFDPDSAETRRRRRERPYHGHGYLPSDPSMHAAFVMSGAGVVRSRDIGLVRNVDAAPTIARILGVELRTATGRVLSEALR